MNDILRYAMAAGLQPAAWMLRRRFAARVRGFEAEQRALRSRYGLEDETPIVGYDAETRARIEALAERTEGSFFAATSGSTHEPKQMLFTRERLSRFKRQSREAGICTFAHFGLSRVDLFIMGSLKTDDSFTSLILGDGTTETGYLVGLTDPTRYLRHPPLSDFIASHGALATRLWLMVTCNAGVLYSTNPSTLAVFLADLESDWNQATALIRDFAADAEGTRPLRRLVRRVGSRGVNRRMAHIAASETPLPLGECVPALHAYCCWDGGYVGTFLESVQRHLPPDRYTHIPMYSMSTETVQTLPYAAGGTLHFLPLADDVLYEFLPEGAEDDPALLVDPAEVETGQAYTMVVSDPYGLVRYQTEDVFRCVGVISGMPDLRFERRRGLTYSFTGEKLTGEQLTMAYDRLRAHDPGLVGVDMTCMPSRPPDPALPGYRLVLAYPANHAMADANEAQLDAVATRFDGALREINSELASKHVTNRLAPTRALALPYEALAAALDRRTADSDDRTQRSWESQFKLTPLTRRLFEDVDWTS